MELSEAKEILKLYIIECEDIINFYSDNKQRANDYIIRKEAIETVLKALDNSIPKEKIEKKIETLEFLRDDAIEDNHLADARNLKERIEVLQELLGQEIEE